MKLKSYLLILMLLLPVLLYSQEKVKSINITEAVESAVKTNISVQLEEIQLKQSERNYKHSWNNILPSVSGRASVNSNGGLTSSSMNSNSFDTGVSASLNLNLGIKNKIDALKLSYENGKTSYKNAIYELEYEVTSAFYSLLVLENQVKLNEEYVQSYKTQYEQTKSKKEKGLVSELDLLSAQVNYETAKINLRDAEKSYKNNLNEFLSNIGITVDEGEKVELSGTLDDCFTLIESVDTNQNIDELVENNSSVESLKTSLQQTELNRSQMINSSFFPSLSLSANVNPYSYSWNKETSGTGNNTWSVSAGLSFSLDNYLPGSAARDNISDLDDTIESLKLQIKDTKSKLKIQISEMINDIELGKDSLENCRLSVELAKKSWQMAELAFKNGTKDLLSLQNIQSSYSNAQAQYMNQQLSLINTVLSFKKLISE